MTIKYYLSYPTLLIRFKNIYKGGKGIKGRKKHLLPSVKSYTGFRLVAT